jgi:hypothetical protein
MRGFRITTFLMDGQFASIRGDLADLSITLNTVARGEHVPEIERHIRTMKERVRCVYATLPFTKIPNRMLVELVYFCVFWLNSFPAKDGISDTISPRTIVHGTHIDFNKHAQLEFGAYVQSHEEHDNTMATRTTGAISLRPTGNAQGGYYLFSLSTGRVLNRNHWTSLPMPQEVIDRVHVLARRSHAALTFADRDGIVIPDEDDDDDNDGDYEPDEPDPESEDEGTDASDDDNDDDANNDADIAPIDPDYDIAGVFDDNAGVDDNPNGDNTNEPAIVEPNAPNEDGEPTYQIEPPIDEPNDADPTGNEPAPGIPVMDAITIANEELAPAETNAEYPLPDVRRRTARSTFTGRGQTRPPTIQSAYPATPRLLSSPHYSGGYGHDSIQHEERYQGIRRSWSGRRTGRTTAAS